MNLHIHTLLCQLSACKDLISPHEIVQDAALKDYYNKLENSMKKRKSLLKSYLFIAHYVNPCFVLWFVSCYWLAGMLHYYMVGFEVVLIILVIVTVIIVVAFVTYFWFWQKIVKLIK